MYVFAILKESNEKDIILHDAILKKVKNSHHFIWKEAKK